MTLGTRLEKRMGRLALAAAVVTVALLVVPTIASPESQIVIRGAEHSSHLRLTVSGNDLLVHGYMYPGQPAGCRYAEDAAHVACPLDGVGSVEVDMGPGNDKVDVLDPLPIPLTVYLGDGSDGFHGNNESDTCYSQGAKKNRCLTGAGDDVCVTGQRNSDCFMGAGDDVCMHGAGSDACWGDAGNDVCYMGPGMDGCHGGTGNDRLYGGGDSDRLFGGPGNDLSRGRAAELRQQRRLLGRSRQRRLPDGAGDGRLPRRGRQRPPLRRPPTGSPLRRPRSRLLQRRGGPRPLDQLRDRPGPLRAGWWITADVIRPRNRHGIVSLCAHSGMGRSDTVASMANRDADAL